MSDNNEALQAALESYAARMSAEDFAAFQARVRPPGETLRSGTIDPATRQRALMGSIVAKRQTLPAVDANGYRVPEKPRRKSE